ncbi:MAG TPA: alpha/beta hydrolase [Candidatus Binatia bacterium]|nr:alpha/beta hydrolase [Candidatus Binatia bacterium]
MRDVARVHYGPLAALAGDRFDSLARIGRLGVPILVAHGDRDELVPFALGERLFAAAPEPKRFFRARGASHNDVFATPGLIEAIAAFAREVAGG